MILHSILYTTVCKDVIHKTVFKISRFKTIRLLNNESLTAISLDMIEAEQIMLKTSLFRSLVVLNLETLITT